MEQQPVNSSELDAAASKLNSAKYMLLSLDQQVQAVVNSTEQWHTGSKRRFIEEHQNFVRAISAAVSQLESEAARLQTLAELGRSEKLRAGMTKFK